MTQISFEQFVASDHGLPHVDRLSTSRVLGLPPESMDTLYQPIFDLSGHRPVMKAVECFTRGPKGSSIESSEALFSHARRHQAEAEFDEAAIALAIARAGDLAAAGLNLHVNVHASTLSASFAASLLASCWERDLPPSQLVLELVEQGREVERDALREAINHCRKLGFRIALDDIGIGQSNFMMLYVTRPEVLKIDRFFVHGVSHDSIRRAMVVAIQHMAKELGSDVVAEGLEEPEDLHTLYDLGIRQAQGYLLSEPASANDWTARQPNLGEIGRQLAVLETQVSSI